MVRDVPLCQLRKCIVTQKPESISEKFKPSPTVWRLGIVSFLGDISSEMLYPITPIFLTLVLGASATSLGVIEGVAEGIASLLKTYSGRWSDRIGKRKVFVWVGYLFATIAKPMTGAATSWLHVLFARSFDRVGKGMRTAPRDALLAEAVEPRFHGAAFGFHRMLDTLGAALGPLIAVLFLQYHSDPAALRSMYFLAVIPGLLAFVLVLTVREGTGSKVKSGAKETETARAQPLTKSFKTYLWGWGVFSFTNSSDVFLLLKAQKSGIAVTHTIFLYAFYNLLYALLSPTFGSLSDRIGRKKVLILGLGLFSVVYGFFGFATESWHFWILFGIYGLFMAATEAVGKAFAVDLIPKEIKATGLGILGTVTGLSTILASVIAGLIWDYVGGPAPFLYGAVGAVTAIVVLSRLPSHIEAK